MDFAAKYRIGGDTPHGVIGLVGQDSSLKEFRNKNNIVGHLLHARAFTYLCCASIVPPTSQMRNELIQFAQN